MLAFIERVKWRSLLLGDEDWSFLIETGIRAFIMFLVILFCLRLLGKRGIKQLSVFELGVIIGLGSAAGDPMLYADVGLLPGIVVFIMVVFLYRLITLLINRSNKFEQFVEGKPTCIISEGQFIIDNFKNEPIALDEFYSELRVKSVSHLGQIRQAIIETNGEVSVFFFADDEVKYGLPILPNLCEDKFIKIPFESYYSCTYCGYTEMIKPTDEHKCIICHNSEWVKALNYKRIS